MTLTPEGEALLKAKEACRLKAYRDDAGVLTIGWGYTGPDVREDETITQEEADLLLRRKVAQFDACVLNTCPTATPQQHSAMVVLCYNIGAGAFAGSSVARLHNACDYAGAARAFAQWNKIHKDGKLVPSAGLIRRRAEEAALYLSDLSPEYYGGPEATGAAAVVQPLDQSRTAKAATTGVIGTAAAALSDHLPYLQELQNQLSAFVPYLPKLGIVCAVLGAAGCFAAWYFRRDDHMRGVN